MYCQMFTCLFVAAIFVLICVQHVTRFEVCIVVCALSLVVGYFMVLLVVGFILFYFSL